MKTYNPKVSIVIPVYNGSNYLKEAIDSALAQTYKNIEIIVVNDGSNDNGATEKIAKSYGNKIKYYKKNNGGVATALNFGIKKMTGEYFSWLSHDDMYKPYKIKKQINYLSKFKDKNIVLYSDYELINEHGQLFEKRIQDHSMLVRKPIYSLLRGILNGVTILVPKSAFENHGNFDENLWCTQDYDFWYRIFNYYRFVHQPEILSMTRVHSLQDTRSNTKVVSEGNLLWKRMINDLPNNEKIKTEGSLFNFYLETAKFIKHTPYNEVIDFCSQKLEELSRLKKTSLEYLDNPEGVIKTYNDLSRENHKKIAAFFLDNIVRQLIISNKLEYLKIILAGTLIETRNFKKTETVTDYLSIILGKTTKPRLMFCTGHWLTGGMERVLSNLFAQLKDHYDLFLLTAYDSSLESKIALPDYVTHIKMSNHLFYNAYSQTTLAHAFILKINVVIGFMNLFNGQLDFYDISSGTGVKTIASNNEMYFYPYHDPIYYELIQRRIDVFKKVDVSLWPTNFSAAAYGLISNNSYLMPNPNTFKVQLNHKKSNEKIILCVGRFDDYIKRVDRIIKCFSIISKKQPDAKLVLVGKYDKNKPISSDNNDKTSINDLIKNLNIDPNKIQFVGEVSDVETYYKRATLLLVTSMSEGFGMVINEAACFGVPTVANYIPGLEDLISDGENGFIVEQDDLVSMANIIDEILSKPELLNKLKDNSKKMVLRFDQIEIGNKWKYLINALLKNSNNKSLNLQDKLAYHINDYKNFSKVVFDELNKVVNINLYERNELLKSSVTDRRAVYFMNIQHSYHRLIKSIKTKGLTQTSKIIVKKIYHKTQKMVK